jgi:hypothetical protein
MPNEIEPRRPIRLEPRHPVPAAPIHPLGALTTVLLDNVFGVVEIADPLLLLATSLTVGTICTVTVACVQRFLAKEAWGASIAKGLVMGVIAGVPFQVTGTAAGGFLLAWAGMHEWIKLPLNRGGSANEKDIIDVDPK